MANPSTTGPSGAGTEVLRRKTIKSLVDTEQFLIQGAADHIYTIISIIFNEVDGDTDTKVSMRIDVDNAGSNQVFLLSNQPIGPRGTFVWNDKFIIAGTDELGVYCSDASHDVHVVCTYIDQHFA
tara:strand:- start:225 stop:599 length:375 start_codon:yes stop_codon:yes gene_type:complete